MRRNLVIATAAALGLALLPVVAFAADAPKPTTADIASDTVWVIVTGVFVMFMQAGFAMLEFVFCAVSLAIVWGTMLERTKFIVYILFAIPFAGLIYPLISHQLFGGGWLQATLGAQDFAGSTVVHLTGATAGFAGLLLLGPRTGKYARGRANAIPGHNMPLAQLGVLILCFGWFGFNPGSTLNATNLHFADIVVVTNLAA